MRKYYALLKFHRNLSFFTETMVYLVLDNYQKQWYSKGTEQNLLRIYLLMLTKLHLCQAHQIPSYSTDNVFKFLMHLCN